MGTLRALSVNDSPKLVQEGRGNARPVKRLVFGLPTGPRNPRLSKDALINDGVSKDFSIINFGKGRAWGVSRAFGHLSRTGFGRIILYEAHMH